MRTRIIFGATAMAVTAALVAAGPTSAVKKGSESSIGSALVFKVNPVQSSGIQSLADLKDSADAVPSSEYAEVELRNLDGSGYLRGTWAQVVSSTGTPAYSTDNEFFYNRHQDQFEQVMGYFWVNQAQEYLQSLGFGTDFPGILQHSFEIKIDQYGGDNSYQTDKPFRIRLGKGGVDDAEDAEVIVHEYGHAVHQSQVPGYGQSIDAGAIGESFGDYLAVTVGLAAAEQYHWPVNAEEACPMDWDSVSYTDAPHCIRRFDRDITLDNRHNTVHYDGQIWSRALWEIRQDYVALGFSTADWDTTYIVSQFDYDPDTSFQDAAETTYEYARDRDGAAAAASVKARFEARGIFF
jgi:zinc metalloprotease ZmpB